MAHMMKQDCEKDSTESQLTDAIMSAQTSAALSAQAYQQVLQQTTGSGSLTPQLQFFQAPSNSGAGSLSLPWMMPHYQMMVLPQGVPQSLFASNVLTLQDNHILVAPLADANNGQPGDDPLVQAAEGLVRQAKDPEGTPMGAQGRPSGDAMVAGQADGAGFNPHLTNATSVEGILGRHGPVPVQGDAVKTDALKPPKKPLTPYMLFSKAIWPQVKAANSHLSSVCEIGAVVGALWRELDPNEKQRYNELFAKDKERYDTELRLYLSATGLHASDLAKKQKRKDVRDKSSRPALSTALTASAQHLVQSGLDTRGQAATLPNLGQDWTGQAVQFANQQQLLAQMGLAGQTLYANSDGSVSVDGGLVAFHPQSLQIVPGTSGTVASGAGGQVATIYSDPRHGGLAQSSASKLDAATSLSDDPSRSWSQSQSNLLLYQATVSANQAKLEAQRSQPKVKVETNGPASSQDRSYYAVDPLAQVVKCEDDRTTQLEAELQHLRSALSEKTGEVQSLNVKLEEAYRVVERYKRQFSELATSAQPSTSSDERPDDDGVATEVAATDVATTSANSASG